MSETEWQELQEEAPLAVNACLLYFQERYMGLWRSRLMEEAAVLTYLSGKDFELSVSNFGLPNRRDWYYEIHRENRLFQHERGFATYELAAQAAIKAVFAVLEKAAAG